ncbi:glycosyltransferase family protein [Paramagnetospirillum magneticum]|uniref:Spore protein YkvP/CgeB glycosyl transferase-like domain-containing protein n=1 Tax=Paramagnetospirillum magneticum (strain ATCC 700264 / AMB-1) TaxID=342108 RepID=Q2W975_PARM1|nr:hypothetical protein [Paramagnetospirillum magneticum]BAE49600.1 hypothetical protein amb0796 [Paramagnetospirillum magneticum AMB-1]
MTTIKKTPFPLRLPENRLQAIHPSLDAAFEAHDYLYVARYGEDRPELRGCSLILLGNRVGGELVLDRHNVHTARSCLYRAFGAWRDDDLGEAERQIAEGLKLKGEAKRLKRLQDLIARQTCRVVIHTDFGRPDRLRGFYQIPGIDLIISSHMLGDPATTLPMGQSLASMVPPGPPVDLVLVDDFKMVPVGLRDLGAPVVVNPHDHEWYYEILDELMPEVDLVVNLSSWEEVELNRAFGVPGTSFYYIMSLLIPQISGLKEVYEDPRRRQLDLVFTGGITHDFYRDKRQRIAPLARLDPAFQVRVIEGYLNHDEFYGLLRETRFTIHSARTTNSMTTRSFESLATGTFQLVEEENGVPYIFSQKFECFPVFRLSHVVEDIERHLADYEGMRERFLPQAAQLEKELNDLMPDDEGRRALRFVRQLMFMTQVEMEGRKKADAPLAAPVQRDWVGITEPWHLSNRPDQSQRVFERTRSPHWVRRAVMSTATRTDGWGQRLHEAILQGLAEFPNSLGLNYTLALYLRLVGHPDRADELFKRISEGEFVLEPNETFPGQMDNVNGLYWVADAKIRDRCPALAPYVSEDAVWRSYALNQRADMAITRASSLGGNDAVAEYSRALALLETSLDRFPANESAQRLYLRAAFGMCVNGLDEWRDVFMANFDVAVENDYTVLHDFAPLAVQVLMSRHKVAEAQQVIDRVGQYLARTVITPSLCPEAVHWARIFGLPLRGLDAARAA